MMIHVMVNIRVFVILPFIKNLRALVGVFSVFEKVLGAFLALGVSGLVGIAFVCVTGCTCIGVGICACTCCRKRCARICCKSRGNKVGGDQSQQPVIAIATHEDSIKVTLKDHPSVPNTNGMWNEFCTASIFL